MRVVLIRHGEVDESYRRCYNGHIDIPLSQNGIDQSKVLAQTLKNESFDAVFCSDLKRAVQTLEQFENIEDAVFTSSLREKSWGKHEGLTYEEIIAQGEIQYENFLQWINALEGEGYEDYILRIREFFFEYLPTLRKENILVVTHAGVIRVLLSLIENISLEEAFSISVDYSTCREVYL